MLLQNPLECGHVVVLVDGSRGSGQTDAVNDGAMVELVGDDDILRAAHQCRDEANIRRVSRRVDQHRLDLFELGTDSLRLQVEVEGARDGSDRARTCPVLPSGFDGGFDHFWVGREIKVVVGREHDHLLTVDDATRLAGRLQRWRIPIESLRTQLLVALAHPRQVSRHSPQIPVRFMAPSEQHI